MVQDTKYIIQYCKDSVTRAKNAMLNNDAVIRIGTSPMTPAQVLVDLWAKVQKDHPNIKFQMIPYLNTPEKSIYTCCINAFDDMSRNSGIRTHDLFVPNEARYQTAPYSGCALILYESAIVCAIVELTNSNIENIV